MIILVEPALIDRHVYQANLEDRLQSADFVMKAVEVAEDTWPSRRAAKEFLALNSPFKYWDRRILDIFVVCSPGYQTSCCIRLTGS